jgi:hypothetical protein
MRSVEEHGTSSERESAELRSRKYSVVKVPPDWAWQSKLDRDTLEELTAPSPTLTIGHTVL